MGRFNRKCRHATCSEVTKHDSGYCETHARFRFVPSTKKRQTKKRQRDPFYVSSAWINCREKIIKARPLCEDCRRNPSTHVDHITPRSRGGADLDPWNLQALCHSCHSRKTAIYDGAFGNEKK